MPSIARDRRIAPGEGQGLPLNLSMVNPIRRFARWFRLARRREAGEPEACALATVDPRCIPSLRFVLLKRVDSRGFLFYTDLRSRKARDIARNPHVALVFYWRESGRQVRIEGKAS